MATVAELRNKVSFKLGIGARGNTLESSISDDLDQAYAEVYARLRSEDLVSWAFTSEVPDELITPVVDLVAFSRVDEYGVSAERWQRVANSASQAEVRIRRTLKDDYFTDEEEAKYY